MDEEKIGGDAGVGGEVDRELEEVIKGRCGKIEKRTGILIETFTSSKFFLSSNLNQTYTR